MGAKRHLTNNKFGRLLVINETELRSKAGSIYWNCQCDCGNILNVLSVNLISGVSKSCGCLKQELFISSITKHGNHKRGNKSLTYNSWANMIQRCYNSKTNNYKNYGGRGIKVCEEWKTSFSAFLNNLGPRPSRNHSIDRINNDGNYEPGNCRWATSKEQRANQRNIK